MKASPYAALGLALLISACSNDSPNQSAVPDNSTANPSASGGMPGSDATGAPTTPPPEPPAPGGVDWMVTFGSTGNDGISSISANANDELLVTGAFGASMSLGDRALVPMGEQDAFVAVLDSAGGPKWEYALGASEFGAISEARQDAAGNVYICGSFRGTVQFGERQVESDMGNDLFAAKLDASGTPLWISAFGTDGAESATSLGVDAKGQLTLLGRSVSDELAFLDGGLSPTGGSAKGQLLLMRLDSDGQLLWGHTFGSEGVPRPSQLALAESGEMFIAGTLDGSWAVAGQTLDGIAQGFVAGFDSEGDATWAQLSSESDGTVSFNSLTPTSLGPLLVGSLRGNAQVGAAALTDLGAGDAVVALFGPQGAPLWAHAFGGPGNDSARGVTTNSAGDVLVSGVYQGAPTLGMKALPNAERHGTLVLKLNSSGELLWASGVVTHSSNAGRAIAVLSDGSAIVAGAFAGSIQTRAGSYTSSGEDDAYLMKLFP